MPRAPPSLHFFAAKANCSTRRSSSSRVKSSGCFGGAPFTLSTPLMPLWLSWKKSLPPYRCTPSQARRRRDSSVVSSSTGWPTVGTLHLVDAEMAGDDKAHFVFRKLDERIRPERRHLTLFVRQMLVRRRADDAVFKLARAELCRGKQKAIIVSPYKIRSAMNIISGIVTGSSVNKSTYKHALNDCHLGRAVIARTPKILMTVATLHPSIINRCENQNLANRSCHDPIVLYLVIFSGKRSSTAATSGMTTPRRSVMRSTKLEPF